MEPAEALRRTKKRDYFYPNERYVLRKKTPESTGHNLDDWPKYRPLHFIHIPEDAARNQYSILDMRREEDFFEYFEDTFHNLPNGWYTAYKGRGRGQGFAWFFKLEFEDGRVVNWRKKSKGKKWVRGSRYFTFPYYFDLIQNK